MARVGDLLGSRAVETACCSGHAGGSAGSSRARVPAAAHPPPGTPVHRSVGPGVVPSTAGCMCACVGTQLTRPFVARRRVRPSRQAVVSCTASGATGDSRLLGVGSDGFAATSSGKASRGDGGVARFRAEDGDWDAPADGADELLLARPARERVGVLLLNLGGPECLDDVQPFLYNLFADPDIIRLPAAVSFLQRPLAALVSTLRAPKVRDTAAAAQHRAELQPGRLRGPRHGSSSPAPPARVGPTHTLTPAALAAPTPCRARRGMPPSGEAARYVASRTSRRRRCVRPWASGAPTRTCTWPCATGAPSPRTRCSRSRTTGEWAVLGAGRGPARVLLWPRTFPVARARFTRRHTHSRPASPSCSITRLVVLPLYPQFSISTSGSSLRLLEQVRACCDWDRMGTHTPGLTAGQHSLVPCTALHWHALRLLPCMVLTLPCCAPASCSGRTPI